MDGLDYRRLCDELTVIQAALLVVGEDPSTSQHYVEGWEPEKRPTYPAQGRIDARNDGTVD